jgi:CubicO group peptidase (beta-lactamase class C family)
MRLADQGIINLDKPLYQYLPNPDIDYDDRYKLITARMVLCHTSGFPNWRGDNKGAQLTIQFTPGSKYSYSGEGYEYLANVVAHITHTNLKDLETLYTKEVSKPLGLKHFYFTWNDFLRRHKATGYYGTNPQGLWHPVIFRSASSLQTEAMDYARFLIAVMDDKVLKKSSINEMLKEQIIIPNGTPDTHEAFGLGFYMEPTPYGTRYSHNGSNGDFTSGFVFYKQQKFGYVFFTNCDKGGEFNKKLKAFLTEGK